MKNLITFITLGLFTLSLHAQECDPGDLSAEGLRHYQKSEEYRQGKMFAKMIDELELLIKTDSLWCGEVYYNLGKACEYMYSKKNSDTHKDYLRKSILYYKRYYSKHPNDKELAGVISQLEAKLQIRESTVSENIKIEMVYVEGMLNEDTTAYSRSFYIGKYEVTQRQWEAVMGTQPSHFRGPNLPVDNVTKEEAIMFVNELNRLTGSKYRIPTVNEWEYAAHGGNYQERYTYAGGYSHHKVGWTNYNSGNRTHPVGEKEPNSLGIYDMTGNVAELCWNGNEVVYKGGSWNESPVTIEYKGNPYYLSSKSKGIRLVLPEEELSEQERYWEDIISERKQRIEDQKQNEAIERELQLRKKEHRDSFFPIIKLSGTLGDFNVGYNFSNGKPAIRSTISPGPIYLSALLVNNDSIFSAGAKLRFINRVDLMFGVAYLPQEKTFGGDISLHYQWKNLDISGGAIIFPNKTSIPYAGISYYGMQIGAIHYGQQLIPTFGIRMDKNNWKASITPLYGYDIKDNKHLFGGYCFVGPIFVSAMYQPDSNYHLSAGWTGSMFGSNVFGFHSGVAYSSIDKFGMDLGLMVSFKKKNVSKGNASIGALIYKNKVIPTVGLGGNVGFLTLGIGGTLFAIAWGVSNIGK